MTPSRPAGSWGADRGTGTFDEVFQSENIRVIRTPVRAPRANAYAERWVGTLPRECLDWILILGRRHLESVVLEYLVHYNARIGGSISTRHAPRLSSSDQHPISCRDECVGGIDSVG